MKTLMRTIAIAAVGLFASLVAKAEYALPAGYLPLTYIESDGNAVIDTGITGSIDLSATLDYAPLAYDNFGSFGIYSPMDNYDFRFAPHQGGCFFDCGNARAGKITGGTVLQPGTRYTVKVGVEDNTVYVEVFNADGTAYGARQTADKNGVPLAANVYLFGVNRDTSGIAYKKMRVYSFKLSNASGLVRDFVPCCNPNDEVGLWDKVQGKFYGRSYGTGEFVGPDKIPYAKLDGDGYAYYGADGQRIDPPATGISGLPLAFATSDEYQALLDAPGRVAPAAGVILERDIALTADADWTLLNVIVGANKVDLNGRKLTVGKLGAKSTFTDSSAPGSGGELHVNCATDVTKTDKTTISGSLTLVKDGAAKLLWNGGTLAATNPILITNGVFKLGVTTANVFGNSGKIVVKGKGQFDFAPGNGQSAVYNKTFEIEGDGPNGSGAIYKSGGGMGNHLSTVILTGDATIGGIGSSARLDFRGNGCGVTGDHTLTLKTYVCFTEGTAYLNVRRLVCSGIGAFAPCGDVTQPFNQITEGVFLENGGTLQPYSRNAGFELPFAVTVAANETGTICCDGNTIKLTGTVNVGTGATLTLKNGSKTAEFTNLVNAGTITGPGAATITGTLRGNGAIAGTASGLMFSSGSSWHVECNDEGFTEKADLEQAPANFLASLKKIDVLCDGSAEVATYDLAPKGILTDALVRNIAVAVTDATSGLSPGASSLEIKENRLVLTVDRRDPRPVVAVWTGAANNGQFADPGNWACTNAAGNEVAGDYGVPCESTDVYLNGEIALQIPAGATFVPKSITANAALKDDCDWSGLTAPLSGTIDLRGRNLTITQLGDYEITDSSAPGAGGELHLNCVTDITVTSSPKLSGSLSFVKEGSGKLLWNGGTLAATIPLVITDGVFKLGVTTANVFGDSGKIVVKGKGQFDFAPGTGKSAVYNKTFEIEGDGPDGSGAIYKSSTQMGNHLSSVVLTGDATIGGVARLDFRGNGCGVTGDHTLTLKNYVCFTEGTAYLNVKRLVCTGSGAFAPCGDVTQPFDQITEGVFLEKGGTLQPYSRNAGFELPFAVTVASGEKGTIYCEGSAIGLTGAVNVGTGATLTLKSGSKAAEFANLVNNGMIEGAGAATVTGTLRGNGAIAATATGLTFGSGSSWHVECNDAGCTEKVDLENAPANFLASIKKIDVLCDGSADEKTYDLAPATGLASIDGIALTVTDVATGLPPGGSTLAINDSSRLVLTIDRRDPRPVVAVWTGEAGNGEFFDARNWACTNAAGQAVTGDAGVPCESTDVYLKGEVAFQFPADVTLAVKSITADVTLAENCDWSGLTVPHSCKIDLKGHDLTITQLDDYEITDSSAPGAGGELHLNCVTDITVTSSPKLSGSLSFVKEGSGKLLWNGGTLAATIPLVITDGVFKLGVTTANVFGDSGKIVVKGKGQFDFAPGNGQSAVYNKTFEIEGDGPDGSGAIYKSGGGMGNHLSTVILTGDATIGGIGSKARLDFRGNGCGVTGDHTLTLKTYVCFTGGSAYLNVRRLVCSGIGAFAPCYDVTQPFNQITEGVFLEKGGTLQPYRLAKSTADFELPFAVTVAPNETGTIYCEGNTIKLTGTVNVGTGATLTLDAKTTRCEFVNLVNDGTIAGTGTAAITGTLRGNGAIAATNLAFDGDDASWHVECDHLGVTEGVKLDDAAANFLANLKKIEVEYDKIGGIYDLAPMGGLTVEQMGQIALEVRNPSTGYVQARSVLISRKGRLCLYVPNSLKILVR